MEFRVMDEPLVLEGHGAVLLVTDCDGCPFTVGCRIRDARGTVHVVAQITRQEGLVCLLIQGGDADYFGRLFRNIRLDATLFTLLAEDA
ncbi:MAG: hypothetical protein GX418_02420 [Clostridiales bacterium]|nr:hypothetical protein [Clostridiales bacterium]